MTANSLRIFASRNGGLIAAAALLADIADSFDLDDAECQAMRLDYLSQSRTCLYLATLPQTENVS